MSSLDRKPSEWTIFYRTNNTNWYGTLHLKGLFWSVADAGSATWYCTNLRDREKKELLIALIFASAHERTVIQFDNCTYRYP